MSHSREVSPLFRTCGPPRPLGSGAAAVWLTWPCAFRHAQCQAKNNRTFAGGSAAWAWSEGDLVRAVNERRNLARPPVMQQAGAATQECRFARGGVAPLCVAPLLDSMLCGRHGRQRTPLLLVRWGSHPSATSRNKVREMVVGRFASIAGACGVGSSSTESRLRWRPYNGRTHRSRSSGPWPWSSLTNGGRHGQGPSLATIWP